MQSPKLTAETARHGITRWQRHPTSQTEAAEEYLCVAVNAYDN